MVLLEILMSAYIYLHLFIYVHTFTFKLKYNTFSKIIYASFYTITLTLSKGVAAQSVECLSTKKVIRVRVTLWVNTFWPSFVDQADK